MWESLHGSDRNGQAFGPHHCGNGARCRPPARTYDASGGLVEVGVYERYRTDMCRELGERDLADMYAAERQVGGLEPALPRRTMGDDHVWAGLGGEAALELAEIVAAARAALGARDQAVGASARARGS